MARSLAGVRVGRHGAVTLVGAAVDIHGLLDDVGVQVIDTEVVARRGSCGHYGTRFLFNCCRYPMVAIIVKALVL